MDLALNNLQLQITSTKPKNVLNYIFNIYVKKKQDLALDNQ